VIEARLSIGLGIVRLRVMKSKSENFESGLARLPGQL
jgi:hypothetical protein